MIATTPKKEQTSDLPMATLRKRQKRKTSAVKRSFAVATMLLASSCGYGVEATANPAASAAISALKTMDYRYFVAGGTCAAFSHGITTPIDVVKTRLQANPEVSTVLLLPLLSLSERLIGGVLKETTAMCCLAPFTNLYTNSNPSHSFSFKFVLLVFALVINSLWSIDFDVIRFDFYLHLSFTKRYHQFNFTNSEIQRQRIGRRDDPDLPRQGGGRTGNLAQWFGTDSVGLWYRGSHEIRCL